MPSIPQSLLWISLVVLWLFVLVPMLINKRETVRRTSDVALATRVLNTKSRLIRRSGPAAGHRHDPAWRRDETELDPTFDAAFEAALESEFEAEYVSQSMREARTEEFFPGDYDTSFATAYSAEESVSVFVHDEEEPTRTRTRSLVVIAAVTEQTDPNYLDVDFVEEDSGALPVGRMTGVQGSLFDSQVEESVAAPDLSDGFVSDPVMTDPAAPITAEEAVVVLDEPVEDQPVESASAEGEPEDLAEPADEAEPAAEHQYEYVDDTSGLEAAEDAPDESGAAVGHNGRSRRLDSTSTAAAVTARKYRFRKRVLTGMAAILLLTTVLSATVSPSLWWACGTVGAATVLYLAYLRRQTRIEEQVRRRREHRVARSRAAEPAGGETVVERVVQRDRRDFDVVPTRIQRPGAAVLEIDDEDPIFEHLDEVAYNRRYHHDSHDDHHDLPRAAGQ